jgi:hypothetical protein
VDLDKWMKKIDTPGRLTVQERKSQSKDYSGAKGVMQILLDPGKNVKYAVKETELKL